MKRLITTVYAFIFVGIINLAGFALDCRAEAGAPLNSQPKETPDFSFSEANGQGDTMWMVVQVIFFLVIIIGLFFVIIKFIAKKNKFLFGRSLRSLGGVPLGQNKSIQVVEIGRSLYIVGVGENVQLMEKIDDAEEVAYITEMLASSHSMSTPDFETVSGWLSKLRNKRKDQFEETDEVTASFQQVFQSKMQHLSDRKKMVEELWTDDKNKDRLNDKS